MRLTNALAYCLFAAGWAQVNSSEEVLPRNDICSDATVISSDQLGTVQSGSVVNATVDEWSKDPNCSFGQVSPGEGVWYVIKGMEGGTMLRVTCSTMDCMILTTNSTLGECPSMFLCADASVGRGMDNVLFYTLTTEEDGIYYVYIAPTQFFPGPEYSLLVEETQQESTPAPSVIATFAPVPTPTSSAVDLTGMGLVSLVNVAMFAAVYFSL